MKDLQIEPIIGLEVHIELETESKMFCTSPASHFGKLPNSQVCPICLGLPGALPSPNRKAVEWTILLGLALDCRINEESRFDRKNYFYPDLPKGYQISQYDQPLAVDGRWKMPDGKLIRIRRVHLEEDTGKLIHEKGSTLIDFNRAGVPLVEIVTEPDFVTSEEVKVYLQNLQQIVRYLGIAQADMEKGQMRCEPNVNLQLKDGVKIFYTPITEIKNVNSFRFVQQAVDYEIARQLEEFKSNGVEKQSGNKQTRGWNENKKITFTQRGKEEAEDYRYFPEPDIPPIRLTFNEIERLKAKMPELPLAKKGRFQESYGLSGDLAEILTKTIKQADFYEELVREGEKKGLSPKEIANLVVNKRISLSEGIKVDEFVKAALEQKQKSTFSDEETVQAVDEVLDQNHNAIADFKRGKSSAIEFLVGQIARKTQGKADPNLVRKILQEKLKNA